VRGLQERGPVAALSESHDAAVRSPTRGATARRRLASTALVTAAIVALDQVTKSIALAHRHRPVHLLGPLGLGLTFNSGAAFSLFNGSTGAIIVAAVVLIALLGWVAWGSRTIGLSIAFGLILGGALGNLSDRLFRGHHGEVVDFITLTHWPTFNVADSSITIGVVLVILLSLRRTKSPEAT